MLFPEQDEFWLQSLAFLYKFNYQHLKSIAAVEFCAKLMNAYPYEWSYWHRLSDFDCLIIHKGQIDKLKNDFLVDVEKFYDYIFGNDVFNIFIKKKYNTLNQTGDLQHLFILHQSPAKKTIKTNPKSFNILLVTANNNGNIGDDAITLAAFEMLNETFPQAHIHIDKAPACKQLIAQMQWVVIGGGGVFYDNDFYNAQNYCQYFLYAHEAGVKSCAIGVGALGRRTTLGNTLFKQALDMAEFIVVRDTTSQHTLTNTIATTTKVFCKQDIVFSLQSNAHYHLKKQTDKPVVLFSLIDMKNKKNFTRYQQQQIPCMELLTELFEVKLLTQSKDDADLFVTLKNRFNLEVIELDYAQVNQVISLYQQCDLVLTARLHAFIFATLANTPVISVSTNRKESKLDILINSCLPSCKKGNINMHDYNITTLRLQLKQFFKNPKTLQARPNEVKTCQNQANEIKTILKHSFH